jgi:hypothetical protein
VASGECPAQIYRPESFERAEAPAAALGLSPSAIQALNDELDSHIRSVDAFASGKRGLDRAGRSPERAGSGPWVFYGRFGLLNFQNHLGLEPVTGTRFTFSRTGPSLTGRIYIGIQHHF